MVFLGRHAAASALVSKARRKTITTAASSARVCGSALGGFILPPARQQKYNSLLSFCSACLQIATLVCLLTSKSEGDHPTRRRHDRGSGHACAYDIEHRMYETERAARGMREGGDDAIEINGLPPSKSPARSNDNVGRLGRRRRWGAG